MSKPQTEKCIECGSENTVATVATFMGMGDYAVCAEHAADHGISGYTNTIADTVDADADDSSLEDLEAAAEMFDGISNG